jgi:hypothetical protein
MARQWSARCYGVARQREGSRQNSIGLRRAFSPAFFGLVLLMAMCPVPDVSDENRLFLSWNQRFPILAAMGCGPSCAQIPYQGVRGPWWLQSPWPPSTVAADVTAMSWLA